MTSWTVDEAEALAERCIEACNRVMVDDDEGDLVDLMTDDVAIEVIETTTYALNGPHELAERLRASAYRGGLELYDVNVDGRDTVLGVAWANEPTLRIAEVRLVPRGDRIGRIEWIE